MRRKIIKQGASTLTLSLPSGWTRKFGLKAGEELEVDEQGQRLVISTSKTTGPQRETLDLTKIGRMPRRILASSYIKGCDEVDIRLQDYEQAKRLHSRIRDLQGFEVVEHTKDGMVVKDVTGSAHVELEQLVRRIFHMVSTVGRESLQAFKSKQTDLEYLEEMEGSINRFAELCYRSLNKQGTESNAKTTALYSICFLLEAVADELKEMLMFIRKNNLAMSHDTIKVYELTLRYIKSFEDLYFSFSLEKADAMAKDYDTLTSTIESKLTKRPPKEVVILMQCRNITEYVVWAMNHRIVAA